jgi:hypothetical protein
MYRQPAPFRRPYSAIGTFPPGRRGMAAVLAMLFLVLFSILAISFTATVGTSVQVSSNEINGAKALLAAESGMSFIRRYLYNLDINHKTPVEQLFNQVYHDLEVGLNDTNNLNSEKIGINAAGDTISIPATQSIFIPCDAVGAGFHLVITQAGKKLKVTSTGHYDPDGPINPLKPRIDNSVTRTIELTFDIYERPSSIFGYGVASKSNITMIGNTSIIGSPSATSGSVLSTSATDFPLVMGATSTISGEVSFTNPSAWVDAKAGSTINNEKGESNWKDNVHFVDDPDFPEVDTADYVKYVPGPTATGAGVVSTKNPAGTVFSNIRIKAGANPTFSGNTDLKGVIYVESPNMVTFAGNAKITGIIVVQNTPTGDWTTNSIDFKGTVDAAGVNAKDANGNYILSGAQYTGLPALGGAFILAPKFTVKFGGNAGTTQVAGSIIASALDFYGSVATSIDGSVINLDQSYVNFQGKASVTIKSKGTRDKPHGLFFGSRYEPLPETYQEVTP